MSQKPTIFMLRSNPVNPDPRVEKEARVLAERAHVVVLAWDRTGELPIEEPAVFGIIRRYRGKSPYGSIKMLLKLVGFNLWLARKLLFGRYDAVHAADLDTGFTAALCMLIRRKYFVYDMYDCYAEANGGFLPGPAVKVAWKLESWVVKRAHVTIIVDDKRREQIKGMRPRQLEIVYNSPEPLAKKATIHQEKGSGLHVFYVGVLARNRGFEYLIDAAASVPHMRLVVGGFGADEQFVKEQCERHPKNVLFIGRQSYADVMRLSQESDVLFALYDPAVPNHTYSSPNKLFEAMMLGLPIIVSDHTGMSDIVREVGNGLVIPYGNGAAFAEALEKLKDDSLRKKMGTAGQKAYEEQYGWPVMAKRLKELYVPLYGKRA